jgi:hypothetical protein
MEFYNGLRILNRVEKIQAWLSWENITCILLGDTQTLLNRLVTGVNKVSIDSSV